MEEFYCIFCTEIGIIESSIEEPLMGDDTVSENPTPNNHVTFQLVEAKLVDSLGYSYNGSSRCTLRTYKWT